MRSTRGGVGGSELETSQGRTTIADNVVQKIAGIAARNVSGVYELGGGGARALGALRERIPGGSQSAGQSAGQGVSVEVGDREAAVDLDLVVEYGVSIADLAASIRRNVITAVECMTGLSVTEVNVTVKDIHCRPTTTPPRTSSSPPGAVTDTISTAATPASRNASDADTVKAVAQAVAGVHGGPGSVAVS